MLRSKHLFGLILASTLIATLVPFSAMVYAQTKEEAKSFIKVAERAKDKADELMEIMESEGLDIPPDTMERYNEGLGNLTAAEAELEKDEPDFNLAVELAKKAMEAFKEVYEELYTLLGDAGVTTESDDEEKAEGLSVAMDRAIVRMDRIRDIVLPGTVAANVTKILDSAKTYIDKARTALAEGSINEAAWNWTQANKLIGLAHSLLKKGGQELKVKRMEHYIDILEKFCDRLQRLAEKAGPEAEALLGQLKDVKQLIEDAIKALNEDPADIQRAMDKLIEARNQLEEIKQDLLELRRGEPGD